MSFWDSNIEALGYNHEHLAMLMEKYKELDTSEFVVGETARDGNAVLVLQIDGQSHMMNSRFRPVDEASKYAQQFEEIKDFSVPIFFGFGNGLFAQEICKHGSEEVRFVFYEPSMESFVFVLHEYDLKELFLNVKFRIYVAGVNEREVSLELPSWIEWSNLPLSEMYRLPKYVDLYPYKYKEFLKLVRDVYARAWLVNNTMSEFAQKYLANSVGHLRFLFESTSAAAFIDQFPEDMVAVIVAAGPSLSKNIQYLKEIQGKAFILSVDTAYRRLRAEGIVPNAVMGIDPRKGCMCIPGYAEDFKHIMWITESNSNVAPTNILHSYRTVFVNGGEIIANQQFEKAGVPLPLMGTGGSVANSAFSLLELWGFKTIIMIGQDLALTGNRRYSDVESDAVQDAINQGYFVHEIEGYYGDTVTTREDYLSYLKWYEGAFSNTPVEHIINATEGGAMIAGATNMPFKEAIDTYIKTDYDVNEIIDDIPRTFSEEQKDEIEQIIRDLPNRARYFKRKFKEGKSLCERAQTLLARSNYDEKEYANIQKRLSQIDDMVTNEDEFILIANRACDVDQQITRDMQVNEEETLGSDVDVLKNMEALYAGYLEAADELEQFAISTVELLDQEGRR